MKRQNLRTVSLIVVTFTYLLIGAAIFGYLESEHEVRQRENLELIELIVKRKYNISEDDFTVLTTTVIKSVPHKAGIQWKFSGAFYFATTVVTTIGYGHSTPATMAGRSFCMIYALIGIPLGLVMFQSIGERLNTFVGSALKYTKRCFKAKNPEVTQTNLVMVVSVLSTILMTSMAAVFAKYERWEYFDALYYCFITLTTIGFGDYVALQKESALQSKPEYVALSLIFILFGLSVVSSAVNLLVLKFLTLNTEDERRDEQLRYTANLNPILLEGDVITHPSGAIQYTGPQSGLSQSKALQAVRSETGLSRISIGSNRAGEQVAALSGSQQVPPWSTSLNYRQPVRRYLTQGAVRDRTCSLENMCGYDQETIELGDEDEDDDDDEDDEDEDDDDDDDDDEEEEEEEGQENVDDEDDDDDYHYYEGGEDGNDINDGDEDEDGESQDYDCDGRRVNGQEREHFVPEVACHDYFTQNFDIHSSRDFSHLKGRESCETGTEEYEDQDDDESAALAPKLAKTTLARWPPPHTQHPRRLLPLACLTNPLEHHRQHRHHQPHQHTSDHQQHRTYPPHPPGQHEPDSMRLHHRHRQRHRDCLPAQQTGTDQQQAHRFQRQVALRQHLHLHQHQRRYQSHHPKQQPEKQFRMLEELQRTGNSRYVSSPSNNNAHLLAIEAPSQSLVASKYSPSRQLDCAPSPSQLQMRLKPTQSRSRSRLGPGPTVRDTHLSSCSCSWLSLSSNAVNLTADNCSQCLVLGAKDLMIQQKQQQRRQRKERRQQQHPHRFCLDRQPQQPPQLHLAGQTGLTTLECKLLGSPDTFLATEASEESNKLPLRIIPPSIVGKCQQLVSSPNNARNTSRTAYSNAPATQVTPVQYLQGQVASPLDSTNEPTSDQSIVAAATTTTAKQAVAAVRGKRESLPTLYGPISCKSDKNNYELCKSFSSLAQSSKDIQATTTTSKWPSTGHQDQPLAAGSSASKRARTLPKLVCKCCCQHLECIEYALQSSKSTTCQGKQEAKDSALKGDKGGGHKLGRKGPGFSIGIPGSKSFGEGVNVVDSEFCRGEMGRMDRRERKERRERRRRRSSMKLEGDSVLSESALKSETTDQQTVAQSRDEGQTNELSDKAKGLDAILGADQRTEIFSIQTSSAKLFKHKGKQTHSD